MVPFLRCCSVSPLLLLSIGFLNVVQGLLKTPENTTLLVSNPRPDIVYLFQFARTENSPSQAALNLKVETWLKWNNITFHRLNNQFFLGSPSTGTAPFAFFDNKFIDGSDAIVEQIAADVRRYKEIEEEKQMRGLIDDVLFKILMFDRANSLEWMLGDEGIVQQMGPILGINQSFASLPLGSLGTFSFTVNRDLLIAFFDAVNHKEKRAKFVRNQLKREEGEGGRRDGEEEEEEIFEEFDRWVREKVVKPGMETILMDTVNGKTNTNRGNSMAKLVVLLNSNILDLDKYAKVLGKTMMESETVRTVNKKPYSELNDEQLGELLEQILGRISKKLKEHGGKQLFSVARTPADASLFGILVQYFETPLNFKDTIGKLFKEKEGILHEYIQSVKDSLGLHGDKWARLTKYPWTLNYDVKYDPENEAFVPFKVPSATQFEVPKLTIVEGQIQSDVESKKYPDGQLDAINGLIATINSLHTSCASASTHPHSHPPKTADCAKGVVLDLLGMMGTYLCRISGGANACEESKSENLAKMEISQLKQLAKGLEAEAHQQQQQGTHHEELIARIEVAVRSRVFAALVAYNEGVTAGNVLNAVVEVQKEISRTSTAEQAAELSSDGKIGNEL